MKLRRHVGKILLLGNESQVLLFILRRDTHRRM